MKNQFKVYTFYLFLCFFSRKQIFLAILNGHSYATLGVAQDRILFWDQFTENKFLSLSPSISSIPGFVGTIEPFYTDPNGAVFEALAQFFI